MFQKSVSWLWLMVALLVLVGCELPNLSPPDDGPPVPVSEEAAAQFEQKMQAASQEMQASGSSTVTVSQEEMTSFIQLRLLQLAEAQQGYEVPLTEPQIYFKEDGTLVLRGNLEFQGQVQPLRVAARPRAVDGSLNLEGLEGRVGPVPVPGPILAQVEGMLADAIMQAQTYGQVTDITITEGALTISGTSAP